ncbi:mitochondrial carrier [Eremomyces bilateralis CBS 781.70]|uniref:Mitochondrial carrier n=1 Tax=Eremomyces bilateralis CBS 781.70 TaxID=1392243 RepID=A0A6G1FU01_9PEZI|nr:mitochondrial carrier [Eremomyces bilateralis CBS 781.70]KAF1809220.1 mitochondrial carrier [Eremomyces bilateralis CBS 781.70]
MDQLVHGAAAEHCNTIQLQAEEKKAKTSSPAVAFASGAIAGGVECFVTYPFEFTKTSVQLRGGNVSKNPFVVAHRIVRTQGVSALYTGCNALVTGTMAKCGVRFFVYDGLKEQLASSYLKCSNLLQGVVAGMGAGIAESVLVVTPIERIKTALIDDAKSGKKQLGGGLHAMQVIVRTRGIADLYKGLMPTMLKQAMTSGVRMGSYNILKELGRKFKLNDGSVTIFMTGALAGTITVYATQPFDSIKTRSQALTSMSMRSATRSIILEYGMRGLWQGSTMRLGRLLFSGGIVFTVYEKSVQIIESRLHLEAQHQIK